MQVVTSHSTSEKAKFIFLAIIMVAIAGVILMLGLGNFLNNFQLFEQYAIAVYASSWALPMAIASPVFILLAFCLVLRLVGKDKGRLYTNTFNLAVGIGVVAILVRLPMGYMIESRLKEEGYSYCFWYTSPANFRPQVWVRSPEYCIEQTGVIRRPLMDWLQALPDGGRDVTAQEVRAKAMEMLEAYEAGERFLD